MKYFLSLVFLVSFLVVCCKPVLATDQYTIYKNELQTMLQSLDSLEVSFKQAKIDLKNSEQLLKQQREQLEKLKAQISLLEKQSTELQTNLILADVKLTALELSFEQYRREAETKIKRLTTQRNGLLVGLLLFILKGAL